MFFLGTIGIFLAIFYILFGLVYSLTSPCLVGILVLLFSTLLILYRREKVNIFSPFLITVVTITFCFGLVPLYFLFSGQFEDLEISHALIFVIIFSIAFIIGYCLRIGNLFASKIPPFPDQWSKPKLRMLCFIAILGGILGYISLLFLTGFIIHPLQIFKNLLLFRWEIENYGVTYIKLFTFYLLSIPLFLTLAKLFKNELKGKKILFFIFTYFIFYETLSFTTGSRGAIIFPLLSIGVMYSYLRKPISLRYLFLIIPIFIFIVALISLFYLGYRMSGEINVNTLLNVKQALLGLLDRFGDGFKGLTILISQYESKFSFLYGRSLFDFLIQPISRNLWPDKLYYTGTFLTKHFFPEVFGSRVTYEFSFIGELFVNLHFAGVIVGGLFTGIFIKIFHLYLKKHLFNKGMAYWYISVFMFPIGFLLAGFNSSATISFLFNTLMAILILNIIKFRPAKSHV